MRLFFKVGCRCVDDYDLPYLSKGRNLHGLVVVHL